MKNRFIAHFAIALAAIALAIGCAKSQDSKPSPDEPKVTKTEKEPAAANVTAAKSPETSSASGKGLGAAPDFTLEDLDGKAVSLAQYKGKTVVLEWFNPDCPFVKYAHGDGPLKDMAATATGKGIVWLAINSGAPGKQGHGVARNKEAAKSWNLTHPILIDEKGEVGKAYGAKATPHMYVINGDGNLVYRGAIDNAPFGEVRGEGAHINFVDQVLTSLATGKPIQTAETSAYGCSVKY